MPLSYDAPERIFTLSTERTTYQMRVDEHGYLLHLYYGANTSANTSYLITYADRSGMCGCPHDVADRTYSLDVLPQEYPFQGAGDMRSPLLMVRGADGTFGCDLRYKSHELRDGKVRPAGACPPSTTRARRTVRRPSRSPSPTSGSALEVELLYGVMPACDVITRAACHQKRRRGSPYGGEGPDGLPRLRDRRLRRHHLRWPPRDGAPSFSPRRGQRLLQRGQPPRHVLQPVQPGDGPVRPRRHRDLRPRLVHELRLQRQLPRRGRARPVRADPHADGAWPPTSSPTRSSPASSSWRPRSS